MLRLALTASAGLALSAASVHEAAFAPENIISKDVVIIGGGSSGTYGAVRLREDYNKSIVVVEKDDHLVRQKVLSTR
jgi:ribulose 1,5-bisphosphate synthetase/thiazole synthase